MLGHKLSRKEINERINRFWDFKKLYPFPVPRNEVLCPCCRSDEIIIKHYSYFEKESAPGNYRVDVHKKCTICSLAWTHGVPIDYETYKAADGREHYIRMWTFREALTYLGKDFKGETSNG